MTASLNISHDKDSIDALTGQFFSLFTNTAGAIPNLQRIYHLFIPEGILIKNTGSQPEIYTLQQFIEPRQKILTDGTLNEFNEEEIEEQTGIFGNIAQRFCTYRKSGIASGVPFTIYGRKTMQFVRTPEGWRMSAVAWDDEE